VAENPSPAKSNVRSSSYYVLRTTGRCWHCRLETRLLAIALPCEHEATDGISDGDADDSLQTADQEWEHAGFNAVLFYIEHLPRDIQSQLRDSSRLYRFIHCNITQSSYWANHCEHCATLLDDHELHCEPAGAFLPLDEAGGEKIQLFEIVQPFEARISGYSIEPQFLRFARRT
jgi:hypothetical protein